MTNLDNQGINLIDLDWSDPIKRTESTYRANYTHDMYLEQRRHQLGYYTAKELEDPQIKKRYDIQQQRAREKKERDREYRRRERQHDISKRIEQEEMNDLQNKRYEVNAERNKVRRRMLELEESGLIHSKEYRDLAEKESAFIASQMELKSAQQVKRESQWNKNKPLELPAPKEGAPMFEGGAVPSVIADAADFNDHTIYNKNKFERKLNGKRRRRHDFFGSASYFDDAKVVPSPWKTKGNEINNLNNKTYENWRKQYTESGLWFKGNGETQSFSKLGFKDLEGPSVYKKGVFNTDHEWLLKSWANTTNDELNDYIKRLQSEGYSKKDLIQIKQQLLDDIEGSKGFLVDRFVEKTNTNKGIKIVNIDGEEYGLLGGGRWIGKNLSMSGINIKTGEMIDIGQKLLNENMSLDEQYEFVKSMENAQTKTAEEIQESIKNFKIENTAEKTFGNTVEETLENATENVLEETVEAAGETIAKEVIEEGTEKILKEATGINVELDDLNKKRTPKKLKKGTGKYKNKTGKQIYEKSRYWGFDYNNGDDIYVHGTKKGTSRFDKKDLYKNDTNTRTNNTNNYADDIKKKLKEIDSWSDDYIRGLSEEDIINYSDNGEVFEKLYDRWNELNSSANTNTNTNTSGDNKQTKQNKQKTKNVFDDYAEWKEASDVLDYTNPEKYYYTGNYRFDTNPETGIPDIDQYKKHTRNLEEIGYDVPIIESIDADGRPIKGDIRQVRPDVDLPKGAPRKTGLNKYLDDFKNMGFIEKAMTLGNVAGAVSDYKNARREGHGVVSSAIRAGTEFALGEALGMYYPLYLLAKEAPGLVIQGTEMLYKENRKMNSAANQQVFGGAQFQDTQQLATMRQSGMEMAKMAQYNLQQTLMGQEATYLHR